MRTHFPTYQPCSNRVEDCDAHCPDHGDEVRRRAGVPRSHRTNDAGPTRQEQMFHAFDVIYDLIHDLDLDFGISDRGDLFLTDDLGLADPVCVYLFLTENRVTDV